ncbi:plasmid partitioning protein ParA [Nostoc linckia z18]|uniref:Plasmid partitioning protein ParA n=2 Tax=Nostoc linckia TaxID=92942 RepID=A0A9Q6EK22_NOSLI|nr:ParA family protein [Nostoc linckia]PHK40494.1 plasmid partitioning protein ParA [Nostoc linckia z15]PHK44383.1 plasmid partitioning protein ParA [Nostoc linckia z16]PHJ57158.1 plasmid partitioning protein ParA [Nostoc linckia z1]PHJ59662.1 plasmid partitioning protein ParA [Nostoc linckia z3]PHJ63962.1 plasmid partitioning protein ParA [Nostoc linckia z2]
MSRVIAFFNQAGGVGKTTLTMNLGYQVLLRGHKVLLIDLDPQASLTSFMGLDPEKLDKTPFDALINEEPLFIQSKQHGMDIAPTNINLSVAEIQLVNMDFREVRLKEAIEPIRNDYDFILIDCPPSLGLLSYSSLVAASHLLIPIETHYKAFQGTNLLLQTIAQVKKRGNRNLKIAGFIPSRYAASNSQDQRTLKAISEQFSDIAPVYDPIPRATAFVDASEQQVPLAVYEPKHPVLKVLNKIVEKMEQL